jgi:curved DNA-binding protein CbpA
MDKESKTYYEVLEVPFNSTQEDIHNAYVRVKNAYSGDSIALYSLLTEDECKQILELVEEAYSILSIPEKRREYDKVRGIGHTQENVNIYNEPMAQAAGAETTHSEYMQPNRPQAPAEVTNQMLQETFGSMNSASMQSQNSFNEVNNSGNTYGSRPQDFNINRKEVSVPKLTATRRFALDFETNTKLEQEIEEATEFTGEFLQKVREYKNVTVERMSEVTKISKTYIRHLEADNWEKLPAKVYTRGFVFQYAKFLKLNPELVATSYLHHLNTLKNEYKG